MASLIGWLAYDGARTSSGAAVASGRAWFYRPGTTATTQTVFSDADGLIPVTQPVSLDAGGRATVYTDTVVRVEIQDSTNATVLVTDRSNAIQAAQVEIENVVATGTDLATGQQVAGGRTTLDTFLTSLYASLGASDGNVLIAGLPQSISSVLAATTAVLFNVKSSTYGAVGDGTTDDTVHVQNAINAAVLAGGGIVFFPPGTYKLTSTLTVSSNLIRFLGVGPSAVILSQATAAAFCLTVTGDNFICDGVQFTPAAATTARTLSLSGANPRFYNCTLSVGATNTSMLVASTTNAFFTNCTLNNSTTVTFGDITTPGSLRLIGGAITMSAAATQFTGSGSFFADGVRLDSTATSSSNTLIGGSLSSILNGCYIPATGGGTFILSGSSGGFHSEAGCLLQNATNIEWGYSGFVVNSARRDHSLLRTSSAITTYTADAAKYQYHEVVSTGASFQWSNPTGTVSGATVASLFLRYKNTSGGAITPTFGAQFKASSVSVATGGAAGWLFFYEPSLGCWVQIGTPVSYTS